SPKSASLPTGRDLAAYLAMMSEFPATDPQDRDDLARVASYSVDCSGRSTLKMNLRRVLNHTVDPRSLHNFLAQVPAHMLCVVTNYDTLLEQAFQKANKKYDVVIY